MKTARTLLTYAAVLCACLGTAHAQMTLGLTAGVDRIDNPLLDAVNPGAVTLLRVEPTYAFVSESDRVRQRFSAGVVIERSSNTALLASREYPSLGYTWAYSSPTSSLELRAALADSATRNTEFEDAGRVTIDTRERTLEAGARWDQELTSRTRLVMELTSGRTRFDSALLEGYREQRLTSRFNWEANERLVYFFEPSYQRLLPSGSAPDASQSRWAVGMRGDLSSEWSLAASAGHARARGARVSKGTVTQLQLTYTGSLVTTGLEWSRDILASGTEAAYVTTQALGLRVGYRVAERSTLRFSYAQSRSDGGAGGRGSALGLAWEQELGANWTSSVGFEQRRSKDAAGATGKGKVIRAGLTYAYPGR